MSSKKQANSTNEYWKMASPDWWDPENPNSNGGFSAIDRRFFRDERSLVLKHLSSIGFEGKLLEVGSGRGRFCLNIAKEFPKSKVIGIDLSKQMVDYSNNELKRLKITNATFLVGNASSLQFEDNYFDVVLCIQVLMHIPDKKRVLHEIKRVTKRGGLIILNQMNSSHRWRTKVRGIKNRFFVPAFEFVSVKVLKRTRIMYRSSEKEFRALIQQMNVKILEYLTFGLENEAPVYFYYILRNEAN
jgi:ubiquinone/menaquinone biosynthesis C-methylase UbiE